MILAVAAMVRNVSGKLDIEAIIMILMTDAYYFKLFLYSIGVCFVIVLKTLLK